MSGTAIRDAKGRLLPGSRLNPGGQTQRVREIRQLALDESEASFRVLIKIRDNEEEDSKNRIAACKEIIRYGLGEPNKTDTPEAPSKGEMGALTLDELRTLARQSLDEERETESDDDDDSDETEGSPH